jgi:DNA-binding NarL/FixJ family response regulator
MPNLNRITIGLFDDHPAISAGIEAYLVSNPGLDVLWSVSSLNDLNAKLKSTPVSVLVTDFRINTAGEDETILNWLSGRPEVHIVIYSGFYLEKNVRDAFELGVMAWVRKSDPLEDLLTAVQNAAAGKKTIRTSDEAFFRMNQLMDLSAREHEVLMDLYEGRSNKEMSDRLGISETTVKTHLAHLFAKLEVSCRLEAVRQGIERGLLTAPVESAETEA